MASVLTYTLEQHLQTAIYIYLQQNIENCKTASEKNQICEMKGHQNYSIANNLYNAHENIWIEKLKGADDDCLLWLQLLFWLDQDITTVL